jgi:K+-transporting ATPase ATPase C chain
MKFDNNNSNDGKMATVIKTHSLKILEKIQGQFSLNTVSPAIKVIILMLVVTGIAYPIVLVAIGQSIFKFQSNGSVVTLNGKSIGSALIAQEFNSPKFFHSRSASDSASGLDPHITPQNALSQISNISKASGIPHSALTTLVELNIEINKNANFLAFAPDFVNVLELNTELAKQYPEIYRDSLGTGDDALYRGK